jgi:predicted acetyltransferase
VAWFGHIIVHPDYRNRGLGKAISESLVKIYENNNCSTAYLIATDLGEPVYKKIGFEVETEYIVYEEVSSEKEDHLSEFISPFNKSFINEIKELDFKVSGENRFLHLKEYLDTALIYQIGKRD